jgi:hypothetical protein
MKRWMLVVGVVGIGCHGSASQKQKATLDAAPVAAAKPVGHVGDISCTADGDFVQADVLAAVKANQAAWQTCADHVVTLTDPKMNSRIRQGAFQFSWQMKDGQRMGDLLSTTGDNAAGEGQACLRWIVDRLRASDAFAKPTNGEVHCTVPFDDSLPR